jgi:O-antigen ligase/polysaccharide polymerase Wzy-like membrane protein
MVDFGLSYAPARPQSSSRSIILVLFAGIAVLLALCEFHPSYLVLIIGAIALPFVLFRGIPYAIQHSEWLIFSVALLFGVIDISFLSDRTRAPLHYGVLAILCLPVLSRVRHSGILGRGGFRLYCAYFAWGAVTIVYSLAPIYSAARLIESMLAMLLVVAAVIEIREPRDAWRLIRGVLLACGIMLLLCAFAYVVLPHDISWASPQESYAPDELARMAKAGIRIGGLDRFRGLLNGPNDVGVLVVVGIALVLWQSAPSRERTMLAFVVGAAVLFDIMADSRSPFVAISVGCALYSIWRWRLRGIVILSIAAVLIGAVFMIHSGASQYVGRDVTTLTGRTDIWEFVVQKIRQRPLRGYGYETSGAIFASKYFPLWWGPWDLGPHSSLHNGYLGHAVGIGIPATALWLFIVLRPWVFALRQKSDPWRLKPILFLVVIPILINNMSEQLLGDFGGGFTALLFGLTWAIAERRRLMVLDQVGVERANERAALPNAVNALASVGWTRAARLG